MGIDPGLFQSEAVESLEMTMLVWARAVMDTDELGALYNLFQLVQGYAEHLQTGMIAASFPEDEAMQSAWSTSWGKLRKVLDSETSYTPELAAYLERNLAQLLSEQQNADHGEPLDHPTREFYRSFIDRIESPAVNNRAAWLTS